MNIDGVFLFKRSSTYFERCDCQQTDWFASRHVMYKWGIRKIEITLHIRTWPKFWNILVPKIILFFPYFYLASCCFCFQTGTFYADLSTFSFFLRIPCLSSDLSLFCFSSNFHLFSYLPFSFQASLRKFTIISTLLLLNPSFLLSGKYSDSA